jgi:DNA-binding MarR family transcriptional regulator
MEEERPLRLNELATLTSIDLSTLSRLVSGMHRKGLLTRDRPESDRRSLQLIPTARGRALASRLMMIAADFEECEVAGLMPREVTALKATLKQLYRNVDRLEEELADRRFAEPVKIPTDAVQEQLAVLYDVGE